MNTATEFTNIPVTKVTCDGLKRPSKPKVLCHRKSKGPAITANKDPITKSLNAPATGVFFISWLLINIQPNRAESEIRPTPVYSIVCDGVKNDSGSCKIWDVTSQLPPLICTREPIEDTIRIKRDISKRECDRKTDFALLTFITNLI